MATAAPVRVWALRQVPIEGKVPTAVNLPSGCTFHPKCPAHNEPCDGAAFSTDGKQLSRSISRARAVRRRSSFADCRTSMPIQSFR